MVAGRSDRAHRFLFGPAQESGDATPRAPGFPPSSMRRPDPGVAEKALQGLQRSAPLAVGRQTSSSDDLSDTGRAGLLDSGLGKSVTDLRDNPSISLPDSSQGVHD